MRVLHASFLPYDETQLLTHFVGADADRLKPEQHLQRWRKRIADAPVKDPAFLHRDETLWTAGALLAVHYSADPQTVWRALLERLYGPTPPGRGDRGWDDLLAGQLRLYFEVGLTSPRPYREWLATHLSERHPLWPQVQRGAERGVALEGHTQLDALLLNSATGFALHFEAKVLSDIDPKTTFDSLRNQLARNLDCMVHPSPEDGALAKRDPELSFLALLTPAIFREHWQSRLYGHVIHDYRQSPASIKRDLPHLDPSRCERLSQRIAWLAFEDIRDAVPGACPWLEESSAA